MQFAVPARLANHLRFGAKVCPPLVSFACSTGRWCDRARKRARRRPARARCRPHTPRGWRRCTRRPPLGARRRRGAGASTPLRSRASACQRCRATAFALIDGPGQEGPLVGMACILRRRGSGAIMGLVFKCCCAGCGRPQPGHTSARCPPACVCEHRSRTALRAAARARQGAAPRSEVSADAPPDGMHPMLQARPQRNPSSSLTDLGASSAEPFEPLRSEQMMMRRAARLAAKQEGSALMVESHTRMSLCKLSLSASALLAWSPTKL